MSSPPASDLDHRRGGRRSARWPVSACSRSNDCRKTAAAVSVQRQRACCAIPAFSPSSSASALIQGSHAAYYIFASIAWQQVGLRRTDHCRLCGSLGVLAEIVVFALSPRFTLPPAVLVVIGGA